MGGRDLGGHNFGGSEERCEPQGGEDARYVVGRRVGCHHHLCKRGVYARAYRDTSLI